MKRGMEPKVLYEDAELVVIDKPAGLMVHPDGRTEEPTLVDWILKKYPEMKGVGEPLEVKEGIEIDRPGIVHRLDKETSGVMVLARTQESHFSLKQQFEEHTVLKIYRAFVYGKMKDERGIINRAIGKSKSDFRLWSAQRGARGTLREARTDFRVIARGASASYIEVYPKTGRTHQIRVHFKAIYHPVVCDPLYAADAPCLFGFGRLALHAKSITIRTLYGDEKTFEAALPPEFGEAERLLKEESAA
jgi:23S rRNA pseudouridine1911/1915/1917 synthase